MKRIPVIVLAAGLCLTACTDQPTEPDPTATVTETVTPDATDAIPSHETMMGAIGTLLEHPEPEALPTGDDAVTDFAGLLVPEDVEVEEDCPTPIDTRPASAGFGSVTDQEDEDVEPQILAAFGFAGEEDADTFIEDLEHFIQECPEMTLSVTDDDGDDEDDQTDAPDETGTRSFTLEQLTHHTDEAFEIQVEGPGEYESSLVLLRNENTIMLAASTPPSDVGLALTLADQLDEMLR